MRYVQFYTTNNVKWINGKMKEVEPFLTEACGDRSVIILDARFKLNSDIKYCIDKMEKRGYSSFEIRKGEGLNRPYEVLYNYNKR